MPCVDDDTQKISTQMCCFPATQGQSFFVWQDAGHTRLLTMWFQHKNACATQAVAQHTRWCWLTHAAGGATTLHWSWSAPNAHGCSSAARARQCAWSTHWLWSFPASASSTPWVAATRAQGRFFLSAFLRKYVQRDSVVFTHHVCSSCHTM